MVKTTIYLPEDLKRSIERIAAEEQQSEAELVRAALRRVVAERDRSRPRIPLTGEGLGDPSVAERAEELLRGFGGE